MEAADFDPMSSRRASVERMIIEFVSVSGTLLLVPGLVPTATLPAFLGASAAADALCLARTGTSHCSTLITFTRRGGGFGLSLVIPVEKQLDAWDVLC